MSEIPLYLASTSHGHQAEFNILETFRCVVGARKCYRRVLESFRGISVCDASIRVRFEVKIVPLEFEIRTKRPD
jgi:hypothetical protein